MKRELPKMVLRGEGSKEQERDLVNLKEMFQLCIGSEISPSEERQRKTEQVSVLCGEKEREITWPLFQH